MWNVAPQFLLPVHRPKRWKRKKRAVRPHSETGAKLMRRDENAECIALNSYLKMLEPHCDFAYTFSGNGGLRNVVVATILKACGLRAGVWDYYFRRVNRPTHWLEMKFGKNGLSDKQERWRDDLSPMGDTFSVAWSAEEALKQLVEFEIIPPGMVFFGLHAVQIRLQPPFYT